MSEQHAQAESAEARSRRVSQIIECKSTTGQASVDDHLEQKAFTIVVFGASGDLAKKKTFPALYELFSQGLIPSHTQLVGFARTDTTDEALRQKLAGFLKGTDDAKNKFLTRISYCRGKGYDDSASFQQLLKKIEEIEAANGGPNANRLFYYAVPPNTYVQISQGVKQHLQSSTGFSRVVVEKPFGHDYESALELNRGLAQSFTEEQLFRIDHYLGKEIVQNLMVLRFANIAFEPIWNRNYIANVQITFKEDIGTQGRGGYFDSFGIIRDVMQNHLVQILCLIAMEAPITLDADAVRDEKVKVLRCIPPIRVQDTVTGQYTADAEGKQEGYLDDSSVPNDSITETFAQCVLYIQNPRWDGVPFIMKCGKAMDNKKAEMRIQFKRQPGRLFTESPPNELVLRVQPNESIYMKMSTKEPGLTSTYSISQHELDLSYNSRFSDTKLPDAYERLILDVIKGDHGLFVRDDELLEAWRIFSPLLKQLKEQRVQPTPYQYGTRGPPQADEMLKNLGYNRNEAYTWRPSQSNL